MKRASFLGTLAALTSMLTLAPPAFALSKTLAWDAPTTNTDGTPATVESYTLYRMTPAVPGMLKLMAVPGTVKQVTDTNVPTGIVCYEVTATNQVKESDPSERLCLVLPSAKPNPPPNLKLR